MSKGQLRELLAEMDFILRVAGNCTRPSKR